MGKLATATIVFQLIEQRRLSLDDTLDNWYPDLPPASSITIANLFNHTSGLLSHNELPELRRLQVDLEPNQIIERMSTKQFLFCSGQHRYYLSTGLVFLGAIIEDITGALLR